MKAPVPGFKVLTLATAVLMAAVASAAPAPNQFYKIQGYNAQADLQSGSQVRRMVADLVTKYNARYAPGVGIADKSERASQEFIDAQNRVIDAIEASGNLELLFSIDMKEAGERFDFFAVTDEKTDLVAIMFSRQKKRALLSESLLYIRPIQALTNGQTVQDIHDETAFYIEAPQGLNAGTGGKLNLRYATNISFFNNQKLAKRVFGTEPLEIAKVDGQWVVRNPGGQLVAKLIVVGGKFNGVTLRSVTR